MQQKDRWMLIGRRCSLAFTSAQEQFALAAIGADGTVLVWPDGRRAAVRGDRVRLPAETAGTHRLEAHENEVIALCG